MSDNATFLGDIADWYDGQTNRVIALRNGVFQRIDPNGRSGWNSLTNPVGLWAAWGSGLIHMSQGFVDALRIGNGIRRGGWGYAQDALRALNVFDGAGRVLGQVGRVLKMVVQPSGTVICTWVSVLNALERTGNPVFINLRDLMTSVGVTEAEIAAASGTTLPVFRRLLDRLRQFNIAVEELGIPLQHSGWEALSAYAEAGRRRGVFVVAFSFARQTASAVRSVGSDAHHLLASYSRQYGLIFQDTNGRIYAGLQALQQAYPEATLIRDFPIVFLRDTAAVTRSALVSGAAAARTSGTRATELAGEAVSSIFESIILPATPIVDGNAPAGDRLR